MTPTFAWARPDTFFLGVDLQTWLLIVLLPLIKVLLIFAVVVLAITPLLTLAERKISAWMQDRIGPNRAYIFKMGGKPVVLGGLFHTMADALKMFTKEWTIPATADKFLFYLAPIIGIVPALVVFSVIPFGPSFAIDIYGDGGVIKPYTVDLQIASINVGVLFVFAVSSIGVYSAALAGWASNNKVGLLGALRASAQSISYEITFGLTLVGLMMVFQSVQLGPMAVEQNQLLFGFLPKWGIFMQPLGFVMFLTAAFAENKRIPFDLPEGESEIVGYFVEYSSFGFGLFMTAEFIEMVVIAFMTTALFLGGYHLPYLNGNVVQLPGGWGFTMPMALAVLLQFGVFLFKVVVVLFFQFVVRWALPRFRYDQLMRLGWRVLLPFSLVNIGVTALAILLGGDEYVMLFGLGLIGIFIISLFYQRKPKSAQAPADHASGDHGHAAAAH